MTKPLPLLFAMALTTGCAADELSTTTHAATTYRAAYGTGLVTVRPGQRITIVLAYTHPPDPQHPPDPILDATLGLIAASGTPIVEQVQPLRAGELARLTYVVPTNARALRVRGSAQVTAEGQVDPVRAQLTLEVATPTTAQPQLVLPGETVGFNPQPDPPVEDGRVVFARALGGPDTSVLGLGMSYQPFDAMAPSVRARMQLRSSAAVLGETTLDLAAGQSGSFELAVPSGTGGAFAYWEVTGATDAAHLLPTLEVGNVVVPPATIKGFNPQPEPPAQ